MIMHANIGWFGGARTHTRNGLPNVYSRDVLLPLARRRRALNTCSTLARILLRSGFDFGMPANLKDDFFYVLQWRSRQPLGFRRRDRLHVWLGASCSPISRSQVNPAAGGSWPGVLSSSLSPRACSLSLLFLILPPSYDFKSSNRYHMTCVFWPFHTIALLWHPCRHLTRFAFVLHHHAVAHYQHL
jgi:hypothetical protein